MNTTDARLSDLARGQPSHAGRTERSDIRRLGSLTCRSVHKQQEAETEGGE